MKKTIAILLLLLLTVSFVACNNADGTPDGMKNAANEDAKFYLYVPEAWVEKPEISSAVPIANDGSSVNAVAILVDDYYTPEVYWNNVAKAEISAALGTLTVIEEGADMKLGTENAKRYVYCATVGGTDFQFMQVIAVRSNMVYTLTYTATPTTYATHMEDVESICTEFRFK